MSAGKFKEMLEKPVPETVALPPASGAPLSGAKIYERARQSRVQVGWYYLCHKCNHWHTRLAGGYPLTGDGVIVTCHHVAQPEDDMREGYLIVVLHEASPSRGVINLLRATSAAAQKSGPATP